MWRVESPSEDAYAHLLADLAGTFGDELVGGQLAQPDWATGVQLLRRVADLRAHPEHGAVGEARRGVDVDGSGVHAGRERLRRLDRLGHDRLRVPRAVAVDV